MSHLANLVHHSVNDLVLEWLHHQGLVSQRKLGLGRARQDLAFHVFGVDTGNGNDVAAHTTDQLDTTIRSKKRVSPIATRRRTLDVCIQFLQDDFLDLGSEIGRMKLDRVIQLLLRMKKDARAAAGRSANAWPTQCPGLSARTKKNIVGPFLPVRGLS